MKNIKQMIPIWVGGFILGISLGNMLNQLTISLIILIVVICMGVVLYKDWKYIQRKIKELDEHYKKYEHKEE